jgi:hypothetical protein
MEPLDVMTAIAKKTGDVGASFYFDPATVARAKELGIDGYRFYFLGRGGVLGDVDSAVVLSAFGYFHPKVIGRMWDSARKRMEPHYAAQAFIECGHVYGRRMFTRVAGLDAYVAAAAQLIGAVDGGAMALFAGVRAEPVPDDAPAAALHQAMVLREMRGSAHLAAITAVGLPTSIAHAIKRPEDVELFGWGDDPPVVTDAHRTLHSRAEELTNEALTPAFETLSDEQAAALIAGTDAMHLALQPASDVTT